MPDFLWEYTVTINLIRSLLWMPMTEGVQPTHDVYPSSWVEKLFFYNENASVEELKEAANKLAQMRAKYHNDRHPDEIVEIVVENVVVHKKDIRWR